MILPEFGPDDRYVVSAISGYTANGGGASPLTTSFAVLDRWYCHREIAAFSSGRGLRAAVRLERALALAAELNTETALDAPAPRT